MKKIISFAFCGICSLIFAIEVQCQINVHANSSIGLNKPYEVGNFSTLDIKKTNLVHTFDIGIDLSKDLGKSNYSIFMGIHFLYQPWAYTRNDFYMINADTVEIGIEAFQIKRNFYFATLPIYFVKSFDSKFGIIWGVNLKCFLFPQPSYTYFTKYYKIKRINWGLLLGLNYKINDQWQLSIKTDVEYPGFMEQTVYSSKGLLSNLNTMLSVGYTFKKD
jgi:hypothetical protein